MTVRVVLSRLVTLKVAFAGMAVAALLSALSAAGAIKAQRDMSSEVRAREAQQCVTSWETREDIRDAVAIAATAGAEALIATATDAEPAKVAAFRLAIAGQVKTARAQIPNPACDLAAAKRRLR